MDRLLKEYEKHADALLLPDTDQAYIRLLCAAQIVYHRRLPSGRDIHYLLGQEGYVQIDRDCLGMIVAHRYGTDSTKLCLKECEELGQEQAGFGPDAGFAKALRRYDAARSRISSLVGSG